ncbi:hypothetical protein EVAR_100094_1 [Eumeta japonica]|uniref:Uncharacterized protein n=1 Tax=Eumeta variegata TaxID=151549 RepID=A0A4C1YW30_EUMVA|nr:hypothetical protein EVAR_100094_1 [Eumeta japonica]
MASLENFNSDILDDDFVKIFKPLHCVQALLGTVRVRIQHKYISSTSISQRIYSAMLAVVTLLYTYYYVNTEMEAYIFNKKNRTTGYKGGEIKVKSKSTERNIGDFYKAYMQILQAFNFSKKCYQKCPVKPPLEQTQGKQAGQYRIKSSDTQTVVTYLRSCLDSLVTMLSDVEDIFDSPSQSVVDFNRV